MKVELKADEEAITRMVGKAGEELGYPVYLIGGIIRDKLLKRPAHKDMDFVCVGSGIELARKASEKFDNKPHVSVFKNFGTAMFKVNEHELEFVGARRESYQRHSRKPVVEQGTLEDDQKRRDFTINALAISLNKENFGELIDPFNGREDLKSKLIRTPLDADITFSDDPLRMMRAIRFATQLDFKIEQQTYQAIVRNKLRIEIVSQERIADELNKIILSRQPSVGFRLLFHTGLLEIIFPEMERLQGVEVIEGHAHKDNFFHTLKVLDNVAAVSDDLWLRWSAILHDIAKPVTQKFEEGHGWTFHGHDAVGARMTKTIFRKLKLPMNEKMKFVQKMVALHLRPIAITNEQVTDSAIRRLLFEAGDDIDSLMALCEADITSKNIEKVERYLRNFEMVREKLKEVEEKDRVRNWQPPISGEEIIRTFGIKPSKEVGEIKSAIKEAILDGEINNNYEEAYNFMLKKGQELGLTHAND